MIKIIKQKFESLRFIFRKKRTVAQYKIFFGEDWLETSVDSIIDHVDKVLFVVSDIPWGEFDENEDISQDEVLSVVDKIKQKYPDKIVVLHGSWNKQLAHVNAGLEYIRAELPQMTHCLYIDSDEIYRESEIAKLIGLSRKLSSMKCSVRLAYHTYFKSIHYRIKGTNYAKATALFPILDWIEYQDERQVNAKILEPENIIFEHPAYVRKSDDFIRKKMEAHKETEPIYADWYNSVWKQWTPAMKDFHPTHPKAWGEAEEIDISTLPIEMVKTFESWNTNEDSSHNS